jgi:cytochrome P450
MSALLQMEPFVDECTALLHDRFLQCAQSGEVINLGHWFQCYAFDVIGRVTVGLSSSANTVSKADIDFELQVGKRFGFLDAGNDISGIMAAIDVYLLYLSHVGIFPSFHALLSRFFQAVSPKDSGLGYVGIFAQDQIDSRLDSKSFEKEAVTAEGKGGKDFLTKLLALHAEDPGKVTMYDVLMACRTNIGAGSDTTGISLSAILYHLCRNPSTLATLRNEVDTMAVGKQISNPVSFQEAQTMPYLQAVLKEALRMHPATGFPLERVVPKGGATICGRFFPEGVCV